MKKYVLTVSEKFPKGHIRAGEETNFPLSIKHYDKLHTIRGNYELWEKRFKKIEAGEAYLSVRIWEGKPYASKQLEIFRFDRSRKIGIEKVTFRDFNVHWDININGVDVEATDLAKNDGLSYLDFEYWFKSYDLSQPMAVIHFTDFRYNQNYK